MVQTVRRFDRPAGRRVWLGVFVVLVLLLQPIGVASAPQAAAGLVIPETPAGSQLAWALEQINRGGDDLSAEDVAGRVAPDFLLSLPALDLIATFRALAAPLAPAVVVRFEGGVGETRANALLAAGRGGLWRVRLAIEPHPPHRIANLFFEPVGAPQRVERPPKSWRGLEARLRKVAPAVGFVAAEVEDGECRPVRAVEPDRPLAIASAFKLYVLGALAREIAAGTASWDEPLPLRAGHKSLPSGDLRDYPNGVDFPIRHFAEQMIAASDNTATDHLIFRLGRKRVERALAEMGHSNPALDVPLLATREWFGIKIRFPPDWIDRYAAADDATQRAMLREVDPAADTLSAAEGWTGPYRIGQIEWFASAADLCRALADLQELGGRPGLSPIYDALSLNPGIPFDPAIWSFVGFKEGYETGVKSYGWLLQRNDGRWFALTAIINDPTKEIDAGTLARLMVTATDLLAATG